MVGTVPNDDPFGGGDIELYHMNPPWHGHNVIAAAPMTWIMCAQYIHPDGRIEPPEPDDPVSTELYGVFGGEKLQVDLSKKLPGSADGRNATRTFAKIGYRII